MSAAADDDRTLPGGPAAADDGRTLPGGPGAPSTPGGATSGSHGATRAEAGAPPSAPEGRFGPYRLLEELGRGGQGVVYLAEDSRLGRRVALKILNARFAADAGSRLRFEREAAVAARLDHPGLCTVYEAGVADGAPYIAMRFVAGETLAARIKRRREASRPAIGSATGVAGGGPRRKEVFAEAEIVEKAARALHAAHEAGLVHRDVKPANIMVEADGAPVVLDFGLARDEGPADVDGPTLTGAFVGTPAYMAPEQAAGGRVVDRRADVWALGAALYETVALARPFEGPTIEALLRAVRTGEPPDLRRLEPACTPELAAVVACALEKDPSRRYADAAAFADDVARARRLEPVRARSAGAWVRARRFVERHPIPTLSALAVVAALATGLGASLSFLADAKAALSREAAAKNQEAEARGRAESLLDFMLGDLKRRLDEAGRLELLGAAARQAADYFADLPPDEGGPTAVRQRAAAFRNVGDVLRAEGDGPAAEARYRDALALLDRRTAAGVADPSFDYERALTLAAMAGLAMARGDAAASVRLAEETCALREKLAAASPDDAELRVLRASGLVLRANARRAAGEGAATLPAYEEAVAAWRELAGEGAPAARRRELGVVLQNQGEAFRAAGKLAEAETSRREGVAIFDALLAETPASFDYAEQAATGRHGLALVLHARRKTDAALDEAARVVAAFRALAARDPLNSRRRYQLGTALHALAVMSLDAGRRTEASAADAEAASVRRELAALDPKNRAWRFDALLSRRRHAERLGEAARSAESQAEFAAAAAEARLLRRDFPGTDADVAAGRALSDYATSARENGDLPHAASAAAEAEALFRGSAASRPTAVGGEEAARAAQWAGVAADEAGDPAAAATFAARSAAAADALAASLSGTKAYVWRAYAALRRVEEARYRGAAGDAAQAAEVRGAASTALDALAAEKPGVHDVRVARVVLRLDRAAEFRRAGRYEDARAAAVEAAGLADDLPEDARLPDEYAAPADVAAEAARLDALAAGAAAVGPADLAAAGEHLLRTGKAAEARDACDRALAASPRRAVRKAGPQELAWRTAAALAAAAEAAAASPGPLRDAREAAAVARLKPVVDARRDEVAALTARAAEEAKVGAVSEPTREAAGRARRRLYALRDATPGFAALRGRDDFRALFAP